MLHVAERLLTISHHPSFISYECSYWHRIPTEDDPTDATLDCFGRDKFDEYRDDMGGVGSFNRENKTIYVGHIHLGPDMEVRLNYV
jgi:hypothetical protein